MVTIAPKEETIGDAFEGFGKGLTSGYQNRHDEMALQKAVSELPENYTPRQLLDAVTNTNTYGKGAKQDFMKNSLGAQQMEEITRQHKATEDIAKAKKIADLEKEAKTEKDRIAQIQALDVGDDEKKLLTENADATLVKSLIKKKLTKGSEEKLSPFEKVVQQKNAEEWIDLNKQLPVFRDTEANLQHAEELSKKMGITGPLKGLIGTKDATELNAVTFPLIQPIMKIFNPSGPVAVKKLEILQDKYQIKATDFPWQVQGKIDALRRFNKQAESRAKERIKMIEAYNGLPPVAALEKFDADSATMVDAMLDYNVDGKEVKVEGMPSPAKWNGKSLVMPDGQTVYSDGERWLKK
jgi:hypothetical protein